MSAHPWMKFYPADWRSDPRLRMCSLAARGLWMEMLALMHQASPYGHLLISGRAPTDAQLAVLAGAPSDQIPDLLGELDAAGVFSRAKEGVIYSRRMVRDFKKSQMARKNGRNGGNPSLGKQTEIPPSDKGADKGGDKTQIPEARSQNEYTPAFEAFWSEYPLKAEKRDAFSAWKATIKDSSLDEINTALAGYKAHLRDNTWKSPKHAAAWLRKERWKDYLEMAPEPELTEAQRLEIKRRAGLIAA